MALLQSSKGSNCPRVPGPLEQFCNIRYRHDVAYGIPQGRRIGFGLLWVPELEAVGFPFFVLARHCKEIQVQGLLRRCVRVNLQLSRFFNCYRTA